MTSVGTLLAILQVPVEADAEDIQLEAAQSYLEGQFGRDTGQQIGVLLADWSQDSWELVPTLATFIEIAIRAGMPNSGGEHLAGKYSRVIDKLTGPDLSPSQARGLIGLAPYIHDLAQNHRKSASSIAKMISSELGAVKVSWMHISDVLWAVNVKPELVAADVAALLANDQEAAETLFADADLLTASTMVASQAEAFGFDGDLAKILNSLCPPASPTKAFFPYLQVLQLQATIVEFYDHPPDYLYEFSPRGKVAQLVFNEIYSRQLVATDNPVLNNFKAVEMVDWVWARSRKAAQVEPATHFAQLLNELSTLPYQARKELCSWLRFWIWHLLRTIDPNVSLLEISSDEIDDDFLGRIVTYISAENTRSRGVIEQRFVDALSCLLHPGDEDWRQRGVGDSVNASNFSSAKLGDSDFQHTERRVAVGYEPHGGQLNSTYLEGHQRSLRRTVSKRVENEWTHIAEESEWTIKVRFVAHEFDLADVSDRLDEVHGVRVVTQFLTYQDLVEMVVESVTTSEIAGSLKEHFFDALDRPQTSQSTRDLVRSELDL